MERQRPLDGWPERMVSWSDIARGLGQVALETIKNAAKHIITEPQPYHSDHYRGAAAQLDRALYDQPELPMHYVDPTGSGWPVIERPEAAQLDHTAVNRWDSMGDYTERSE